MVAMNETLQIAEREMPDGDAALQHSARVLAEAAPLVLRLLRELASTIDDDTVLDWASSTQAEHELSSATSFDRGSWLESGRRVWNIIDATTRGAGALHSLMYPPRWGCQPLLNTAEHAYASLIEEWRLILAHRTAEFSRRLGLPPATSSGPSWERHCAVHSMVQNIVGANHIGLW